MNNKIAVRRHHKKHLSNKIDPFQIHEGIFVGNSDRSHIRLLDETEKINSVTAAYVNYRLMNDYNLLTFSTGYQTLKLKF